jgi:hypothetical protein
MTRAVGRRKHFRSGWSARKARAVSMVKTGGRPRRKSNKDRLRDIRRLKARRVAHRRIRATVVRFVQEDVLPRPAALRETSTVSHRLDHCGRLKDEKMHTEMARTLVRRGGARGVVGFRQ